MMLLFVFALLLASSHGLQFNSAHRVVSSSTRLLAGFGAKKVVNEIPTPDGSSPCACGSGATYSACCEPYHIGKAFPPTPAKTVRSRFSALHYKIVNYMVATTHPSNKEYVAEEQKSKRKVWGKDLKNFSEEYVFEKLIFDNEERDDGAVASGEVLEATVSFTAKLQRVGLGERPSEDMKEISTFKRSSPTAPWLYASAVVKNPLKNMQVTDLPPPPLRSLYDMHLFFLSPHYHIFSITCSLM